MTSNPSLLSEGARRAVLDNDNNVFLSAASTWEIAIKYAAGKLKLAAPPSVFVPTKRADLALRELAIDERCALRVGQLPPHHSDPFDRMLVAQAILHGMALVSPDPLIQQYTVWTIW